MRRNHRLTQMTQIGLMALGIILGTGFWTPDNECPIPEEIIIIKAPSQEQINPYQEEYERMLYPTVRITTLNSTGSGVVISIQDTVISRQDYYILTAAHVVEDETTVNIELYDSTNITGTVVITDTVKDLALIRIETTNSHKLTQIYSARLAPSDYKYYLFTPIWTIGCSLGLNPRPSFGHITHIEKSNRCSSVFICGYEISAPILPGNSGGPVYDARTYEVIGIAVWVKVYNGQLVTTMAGVVPINQIYEFLEQNNIR